MKILKRKVAYIGAVAAAVLCLGVTTTAMAANSTSSAGEGIELVNPGTLTVCTHLPYKPFEFINEERDVVGFDVALAQLLADKLGTDLQVVSIGWSLITSGAVFAADKCDIAMGGATITEKRAEAVLFSDPYFSATQVLMVKKDSGISGLADLKGKRLAVQTATTGQVYAKQHADKNGYIMVVYADLALLTTAVSSGAVAAAIQDSGPLIEYTQSHPETMIAAEFDTGEHYGFMTQKNDASSKKLMNLFNQALAQAQKSGKYDELYEKWFGRAPAVAAQ